MANDWLSWARDGSVDKRLSRIISSNERVFTSRPPRFECGNATIYTSSNGPGAIAELLTNLRGMAPLVAEKERSMAEECQIPRV